MGNIFRILLLTVPLAGCQSIKDAIPFTEPKAQARVANCDGLNQGWDYCYEVAARTCPEGYQVSDRRESSDSPSFAYRTQVTRSMTFRCK